jgi:Na+/melibiose symporter-like transporter
MIAWLESLPTFWAGVVVVGGFVVSTLVVGYLVDAFTPQGIRQAHNDRAGFILAVIGVIYAVLLAFVAIGVWERFQQAEARTYDEAGSLATIYRDAGSFPHPERLRSELRAYVLSVIHHEWPQMQRGERSPISDHLLESADREIRALPVTSPSLQDVQTQMLAAMDTAMQDRQTRLTIDFIGINGMLWMVLIVGAYVTVAFTYLFGFDRTIMQQLMIGGLSLMVGLVLFLVLSMDYPYRGSISVEPDAFRSLLENLKAIGS